MASFLLSHEFAFCTHRSAAGRMYPSLADFYQYNAAVLRPVFD